MPYTPPAVPNGYRIINIGEVISKDDLFDSCGLGEWVSAKRYDGEKQQLARVAFITRIKVTPNGNFIGGDL